jgi:hypothetical protein
MSLPTVLLHNQERILRHADGRITLRVEAETLCGLIDVAEVTIDSREAERLTKNLLATLAAMRRQNSR